jgi:uncharacterized membrane protein YidH (DUF202 family)
VSAPRAGTADERTALAWWRTAQTAIAAALLIAKLGIDPTALGWVSAGLALVLGVVAWLGARVRVREEADPARRPVPLLAGVVLLGALAVVLAIAVLAGGLIGAV